MGMTVGTNIMALNANNSLNKASGMLNSNMSKLASGSRINKAADDASGLSISEKMKAQIKALDTATDNCKDGANMIQTAEGYMSETHDMLNRMVEIAEKSANGVLDDTDRDALQEEMDQLCGEIDRIATTANFNGKKLLDGSIGSNGTVKLSSTAEGNSYSVADTVVATNGTYTGTATPPTLTGSKIEAMSQSKQDQIAADATKMAEDYGKSIGAAGTYTVYVKDGGTEMTLDDKSKDAWSTTNANGYHAYSVAVAYTAPTATEAKYSGGADAADVVKADTATASLTGEAAAKLTADVNALAEGKVAQSGSTAASTNVDVYVNGKGEATLDDMSKDAWAADTNANGWSKVTVAVGYTAATNNTATQKEGIKLQIGESSTAADKMNVKIGSFHTDTLLGGVNGFSNYSAAATGETDNKAVAATKANSTATYKDGITVDISDQNKASAAADALRQVTNYVSDQRGILGAQQNRLEHTVNNLTTASENTTAANGRIVDTDMAKTMIAYTQKNVLSQAAQAMLAQANTQPQSVLQLLQ